MIRVKHIVNSVYRSRTYVLTEYDGRELWIVDCGDVPPLADMISSLGDMSFQLKGGLLEPQGFSFFTAVKISTTYI